MGQRPGSRLVLALLALSSSADCDRASEPRKAAAGPVARRRDDAHKRAELIATYREAHEQGDVEKFIRLIHLEGAEPDALDQFLSTFESDRQYKIVAIHIEALGPDDVLEYQRGKVRFVPNLAPLAWLKVTLDAPSADSPSSHSTHYLIGAKDGRYRIATSRPKK